MRFNKIMLILTSHTIVSVHIVFHNANFHGLCSALVDLMGAETAV